MKNRERLNSTTKCFLKTNKNWIDYIALTNIGQSDNIDGPRNMNKPSNTKIFLSLLEDMLLGNHKQCPDHFCPQPTNDELFGMKLFVHIRVDGR